MCLLLESIPLSLFLISVQLFHIKAFLAEQNCVKFKDITRIFKRLTYGFSRTTSLCSKISNIFHFLFSKKIWVIRAKINKMFVRIANREDPDQTASDLGLHCLSKPF